jgi:hypothetical protein
MFSIAVSSSDSKFFISERKEFLEQREKYGLKYNLNNAVSYSVN